MDKMNIIRFMSSKNFSFIREYKLREGILNRIEVLDFEEDINSTLRPSIQVRYDKKNKTYSYYFEKNNNITKYHGYCKNIVGLRDLKNSITDTVNEIKTVTNN